MHRWCVLLAIIAIAWNDSRSQNAGKISGVLTDAETGEKLIGANIIVTGTTLGASTDIEGSYFILNVPPGNYDLQASMIGYQKTLQRGVIVNAGRTTVADFRLRSSAIQAQEVVIQATRPDVQAEKTSTSEIIRTDDIQQIAGMRDVGDVLGLAADITDGHFRGGRSGEELYTLQGMGITNPLNNASAFLPIMSAVEEAGQFPASNLRLMRDIESMSNSRYVISGIAGCLLLLTSYHASAQTLGTDKPWSERMAESVMTRNPDTIYYPTEPKSAKWGYERGVVLQGIWKVYAITRNPKYLDYIRKHIDQFVGDDGSIRTYEYDSFNIDNIPTGRQLLALYSVTSERKYKTAADTLRKQLGNQPRTHEGGFWHKKIYPYQMWLDGLYMGGPFYAEYAQMFNEPMAFDDVVRQFVFMENHARDTQTGLLYHAWDESRLQKWANAVTGCSPHFWGRAMGWYAWGIVDVLDYLPADHPGRQQLIAILNRLCEAVAKYREPQTGLWYQVVDQGSRNGNYPEASASCMFAYVFAKGYNKGYLTSEYLNLARSSFKSILDSFVTVDVAGLVSLNQTCQGAGLGGNPYRDGSFEYYASEPRRVNDFKGLGPFIMAALELEQNGPFPSQKKAR